MKTFFTSIAFLVISVHLQAGTTYSVTSNKSWNGNYPSFCSGCTFNISAGVTLTLNTNATCSNCTMNGGTITMTNDFTFQQSAFNNTTVNVGNHTFNLQNNGTSFSNTVLNATGAGNFNPTGSLSITGSVFNFKGASSFNNSGGQLDITSSKLYFYDSSFFNATAGPVNLNSSSQMIAGDGTIPSKAYLLFNGPTLNLVDAGSALYLGNLNNYYYNWSTYNSLSNSKTYTTTNNNKNCGGSGQNSCKAQFYFGCGSFSNVGAVTCTTLATTISDFSVVRSGNEAKLRWTLSDAEQNSYFKIEHSTDAIHFVPITTMDAAGNDSHYTYTDLSPETGENDYRISFINPDGKISYSKIISIMMNTSTEISAFPNPATGGQFYIQMPTSESATITVYSLQGQLLYMNTLTGQTKYSVHLPQTNNRQFLVVHIVTRENSSTFNLLSMP
jgi:hypothetical protein